MLPPRLLAVRQNFPTLRLADVHADARARLEESGLAARLRRGARVAVGVGSRGIANIDRIVHSVVQYWRDHGMAPFIFPAMGSHGAATAEGQAEILKEYGIDEAAIGAPVRSSMEVVELPNGELPFRIFMDRHAYEADGVILVNRIKPHTDYHGAYESGLMKMALIGLGKLDGARAVHQFGVNGLREMIGPGAR